MDEVDKTTENDALEDNQQTDETVSQTEGDAEETTQGSESDTVTLTKDELEQLKKDTRKDQDKRWKDRLKGDEEDSEEDGKESVKEEVSSVSKDDFDALTLKTEGITKKKEVEAVIEYARFKNIDVLDSLKTPAIRAELKAMRDKDATPAPSRRTSTGSTGDNIEYWVRQYKAGKLVPKEHWKKVKDALRS